MTTLIHLIFPETFDYSDENCIKMAIKNYCEKHKTPHLKQEIFEELQEIL